MAKVYNNQVVYELSEVLKTRPYFFTKVLWEEIKIMVREIKAICISDFLPKASVEWTYIAINGMLNRIADLYTAQETYESNVYIWQLIDFYIDKSTEYECFEAARNLSTLRDFMCVAVELKDNQ